MMRRKKNNGLLWSGDDHLSLALQITTPSKKWLAYGHQYTEPFYRKPWFLVALAAASIVIIIMVVAILCVKSKSYKYKGKTQFSTIYFPGPHPLIILGREEKKISSIF